MIIHAVVFDNSLYNRLMLKNIKIPVLILFIFSLATFILSGYRYYRTLDSQAPVISMNEDSVEVSVKDDEEKILKGITAKDETDGDVTDSLVVEKMSKIGKGMIREATIVAFDGHGNTAREKRKVKYNDYTHPRFTLKEPLRASTMSGISAATNQVQAYDCIDGNLTGKISVEYEKPENGFVEGDYPVTMVVVNSAGDKQSINATVTLFKQVNENQSPRVILSDYIVYTKKGEDINPYDYVEGVTYMGRAYEYVSGEGSFASNSGGGGLTVGRSSIAVSGDIDYDKAGSQELTFTVMDSEGVEGSVRLIVVVEDE